MLYKYASISGIPARKLSNAIFLCFKFPFTITGPAISIDVFEYISGKNSIEMAKNPPDQFYVKNLQVKDSFFGRKIETILIKGIPELYYLAKWYCPLSSSHKSNEALIKKVLRNQLST
jgi:hypothetical protein